MNHTYMVATNETKPLGPLIKNLLHILLLMILIGLMQSIGFAEISSSVEGTVFDKTTGEPIANAHLLLHHFDLTFNKHVPFQTWKTKTDNLGKYKFNIKLKEKKPYKCYINCKKEGYISVIPDYIDSPNRQIEQKLVASQVEPFQLTEGQIIQVQLPMEKESIIDVKMEVKTADGISGLAYASVVLTRFMSGAAKEDTIEWIRTTDKNGDCLFYGLPPCKNYSIEMHPQGYGSVKYEHIRVNSNENKKIHHLFNDLNPTGLQGTVKLANNSNIKDLDVYMVQMEGDKGIAAATPKIELNAFVCKDMQPGSYKLKIVCTGSEDFLYEKSFRVFISQNKLLKKEFILDNEAKIDEEGE